MNKTDFSIIKLKGSENFHTWKFAMKNFLEMNDLLDCINEVTVDKTKAKEVKPEKLSQAKTRIICAVDETLFVHIEKCESPLEIWRKFQDLFEDKGFAQKNWVIKNPYWSEIA